MTGFLAVARHYGQSALQTPREADVTMPSNSTSTTYTGALAALALSAGGIAAAPPQERVWRLRRMIAQAAQLAAADGVEPLTLAHDAWQAALDAAAGAGPAARDAAADAHETVAAADEEAATAVLPSLASTGATGALRAVRATRHPAGERTGANVLPFRRPTPH